MKENLKKIGEFIAICLAFLGAIGGPAALFHHREPVIALGVLALAAMAAPWVVKAVKDLTR